MLNALKSIARCAMLLLVLQVAPAIAQIVALPEAVARDVVALNTSLTLRGDAIMRFFGLKVYDIRLWTASKSASYGEVFALELVYDLAINGKDIADRSVKEMRLQGWQDDAKLKRWESEMVRIFPDIKQGDSLIGVSVPGKETRFYSRERLIGVVADAEFSRAFFDIWLSVKTSEPNLRKKLIGSD